MRLNRLLWMAALSATANLALAADMTDAEAIARAGIVLPDIPVRMVDEPGAQPVADPEASGSEEGSPRLPSVTKQVAGARETAAGDLKRSDSRAVVLVEPGVNQIIPVARGHLNRIVTPFSEPKVRTASASEITAEGSVIYVLPAEGEKAVTMFVTEADTEWPALSLTLAPIEMPPREVELALPDQVSKEGGGIGAFRFNPKKAGTWETEQPYVDALLKVMRSLALQTVPQGYGLRRPQPNDPIVDCRQAGLEIFPGQALDGSNFIVMISRAENASSSMIEIDESSCNGDRVLAVAAWPHAFLAPGQSTELYVIFRRPSPEETQRKRPSLLDNLSH